MQNWNMGGTVVVLAAMAGLALPPVLPAQGMSKGEAADGGPLRGSAAAPALDPGVTRSLVLSGSMGAPTGLLYEPASPAAKSHIGVVVMHSDVNYLTFSACGELAKRGYRVLCVYKSGTAGGSLDKTILDLRQAVALLRGYPGVDRVVLLGHSGGATLMSAYQSIAENGVRSCQGAEKIHKCPDNLAGLPPADGLMLLDSNWGNAEMTLLSIDPSVEQGDSGMKLQASLNSFSPANGFVAGGNSSYSPEFLRRFQQAAAARERDLVQHALDRVAAIDAGKGLYDDDEPLTIPGGSQMQANNRLFPQDTRLMAHTVKAWPLLHANGSMTTQIVYSVRVPEANRQSPTPSLNRGGSETTVRTFLTNGAIRTNADYGFGADALHGVEWTSTYSSTPGNVESVKVPLLVMGMTGHYEFLASETIYNLARSTDKTLTFVEGANHGYDTCTACEQQPGQFGDTQKTTYDFVDRWLSTPGRF